MSRTNLQIDVTECEDVSASHGLASPKTMNKLGQLQPGCRSVYNADHQTLVALLAWLAETRRAGFNKWVAHGLARCTAEAIILRNPSDFRDQKLRSSCEQRLREHGLDADR